jgi:hypothetical protein
MHSHGHDHEHETQDSLRPRGSRLDERADAALFRAAAEGRPDVLGPTGLLRLQRAVGNAGARGLVDGGGVLDVLSRSAGSPLDEPVRADMEARLGADFSGVRVHTGDDAHGSARAVNAHAYTVGSNIVFQRGRYDTESTAGRTMLAHELTHVVQQRNGPVDGTPAAGGVKVSDPSDRFEREAASTAERVMSAPAAAPAVALAPSTSGSGVQREVDSSSVQREGAEDEEAVQGSFVQRAEDEEETAE